MEKTIKLNNGVEMPLLGYGVFQMTPEECEQCVTDAIQAGYRLIDTAQAYFNEEGVGNAWHKSGVKRDELFLSTKIFVNNAGHGKAAASIDESLRKLRTDYVDLLLVHQAFGDYYGAYRAMEDALKAGKARAIGVSNFYYDRFVDIATFADVVPAINQLETHVFSQQRDMLEIMQPYGTQLMAWGPLAEGANGFFTNRTLDAIGQKYGKSIAQTGLRFLIQNGIVAIPKSSHKERMEQNIDVFDFALSEADLDEIRSLDLGHGLAFDFNDKRQVMRLLDVLKKKYM